MLLATQHWALPRAQRENWEKASRYFDSALQLMPQSSEVQLAIGDCHDQHATILSQYSNQDDSGEGDRLKTKAISHYQQATWLNKESIDSNLKLGAIFIKENRFKEALSHLQRATEISLEKSLFRRKRGRFLYGQRPIVMWKFSHSKANSCSYQVHYHLLSNCFLKHYESMTRTDRRHPPAR